MTGSDRRIVVLGTGFRSLGSGTLPQCLADLSLDGISTQLIDEHLGPFPATSQVREQTDEAHIRAGRDAASRGADALFINTVGDYGLPELRNELEIPVVGAGETVFSLATLLGRFAIVTIWPPALDFLYHRSLERSGHREACLGIWHLSDDDDLEQLHETENFVTEMRACAITPLARLEEARQQAVGAGARAVILGCTCMAPVARHLEQLPECPTLEPMNLGYRCCQHLVAHNGHAAGSLQGFLEIEANQLLDR